MVFFDGLKKSQFRSAAIRLCRNQSGNMLALTALALPIILSMTGLGLEAAGWYQTRREMQNAADAAAIAAASNGTSSYGGEAKAVAATFGFVNNVNNATVAVTNTASCPSGGSNCYGVTITKAVPLLLSVLVGFQGSTTVAGRKAIQLQGYAAAQQTTTPRTYCVVALATSGNGVAFRTNGAPKADLTGCNILSNTNMTCNGHNLNADYGDAFGVNSGCGNVQTSNVPRLSDPYIGLASQIPANPCSSYPQEPAKKGAPLPASNQISGSYSWTGTKTICGDLQLTGDVTLTGSNLQLTIENGRLDTNGYTFKTAAGAGATIIFSGSSAGGYTHAPTGGGTLDIAAPTSGAWSGVAIYQDPGLTSGVDISAAGNSPTWNITGLVYLPNASVTFSGAVGKAGNGQSCFVLVIDSLLINGTGSILSTGGCAAAGLTMPTNPLPDRGKLVT